MELRRRELVIAAAGAALAAFTTLIWSPDPEVPAAVALGGLLGLAPRYPRLTWAAASALILVVAAQGTVPGGDTFPALLLFAAHGYCAGRWDRWHDGLPGIAALAVAAELGGIAQHDGELLYGLVPLGAWVAARVVRQREQVAAQLAERAQELDDEREAYAALSVRYERARVAAELHDIVAHAISVMVVQASAGQRLAPHDPEATNEAFAAISGAAREARDDMGRLVALLSDDAAIGPAPDLDLVEELVARAAGSGLDVTLRLEGDREGLPAQVAQVAYRVVQEGLTNALRYASGAGVTVLVRGESSELVVEVQNGPATDDASLAGTGTGNGLHGLRERAAACAGTLEAGPTPSGGWLVRARLPRRVAAATRH
jgi:signal transduction histidine kinase